MYDASKAHSGPPEPPEVVKVEAPRTPVKVDLACGQNKTEGFVGVDASPCEGVDIVHDLTVAPWPFEDGSVDEVVSNHFVEHLDGEQQMLFFNELWRILKVGGTARIVTPNGWHSRAWQDPTHKRPIVPEVFYYYNRPWREANRLTHYPITCNFDTVVNMSMSNDLVGRSDDYRNHAMKHYVNVIEDLIASLTKEA
jgi:SAM-dependent methyltransferase